MAKVSVAGTLFVIFLFRHLNSEAKKNALLATEQFAILCNSIIEQNAYDDVLSDDFCSGLLDFPCCYVSGVAFYWRLYTLIGRK